MKELSELFRLDGKILVLTGATGLIGHRLFEILPFFGAKVIFGSRDALKAAEMLRKYDGPEDLKPIYLQLDLKDPESIKSFFSQIKDTFGRVDILINSAFPKTSDWAIKFEDTTNDSLLENLTAHAGGYFICCQEAVKIMKNHDGGVILNFGSIYGHIGPRFSIYEGTEMNSAPVYPLIKGGIHSLTKYLASYLGSYNIRVNCIAPGGVKDESTQNQIFIKNYEKITPLKRMGNPDDIIGPVLFLCSDASSYVTGVTLFVDGGWTAC